MKRILSIIILFLVTALPAPAQYYLGVISGEAKKIPIAVLDISDETGSPALRAMALEVLQSDLRRSRIFEVMDPKKLDLRVTGNMEPATDLIKRGGTFGLTGVAWAKMQRKDKDIVLSGKLYDAASGMRITNKDYFGNEETFRRMVHAFADENYIGAARRATDADVVPAVDVKAASQVIGAVREQNRVPMLQAAHRGLQLRFGGHIYHASPRNRQRRRVAGRGRVSQAAQKERN